MADADTRECADLSSGAVLFLFDLVMLAVVWPPLLAISCGLAACVRPGSDALAAVLFPAAYLACLYALGAYRREAVLSTQRALARLPLTVGIACVAAAFATGLASFWIGRPSHGNEQFAAAFLGFCFAGATTRVLHWALRGRGVFRRRILVLGAGARAFDLMLLLKREGSAPHYDVDFLHDPALGAVDARLQAEHGARIVLMSETSALEAARRLDADQVVVAPDERRGMALDGLLDCKIAGFPVVQYLAFLEREIRRVDIKRLEVSWLLYADGFTIGELDSWLKRLLDLVASAVMLVLFAPVMLAAAVAIKADDGGPLFYAQERVSRGGKRFHIVKFRTMRTDAEAAGAVWAVTGDPRVTRVGRFLRKTRIDEMPQLLNVLRGDMSLVGPRPERPGFVTELAAKLPLYNERHAVKAGLTGWAQINYPYGASLDDARSKLSYDLYYVKNFSVIFDVLILLQTLRVVLFQSGAR